MFDGFFHAQGWKKIILPFLAKLPLFTVYVDKTFFALYSYSTCIFASDNCEDGPAFISPCPLNTLTYSLLSSFHKAFAKFNYFRIIWRFRFNSSPNNFDFCFSFLGLLSQFNAPKNFKTKDEANAEFFCSLPAVFFLTFVYCNNEDKILAFWCYPSWLLQNVLVTTIYFCKLWPHVAQTTDHFHAFFKKWKLTFCQYLTFSIWFAPLVMASIGARKRKLAGKTVHQNGSIDTSFYPLYTFTPTSPCINWHEDRAKLLYFGNFLWRNKLRNPKFTVHCIHRLHHRATCNQRRKRRHWIKSSLKRYNSTTIRFLFSQWKITFFLRFLES